METFLQFLDGKKAVIGNILQLINSICVMQQVYSVEIGAAIAGLILALTGAAVFQSNKTLGQAYRTGKKL